MTKKLVLASSSPYRRALLERLRLPFITESPDVDETPLPEESPVQLVLRLSFWKARALAKKYSQHLIIGADQVVVLEGQAISKPGTREKAVAQLTAASGNTVLFHTGVCVLDSGSGQYRADSDVCAVTFKTLSPKQIENYVDIDQPFDCAGGFKAESLGIALFERITGDDPNALVGLPLIRLIAILKHFGVLLF
jgi:septum formation protein